MLIFQKRVPGARPMPAVGHSSCDPTRLAIRDLGIVAQQLIANSPSASTEEPNAIGQAVYLTKPPFQLQSYNLFCTLQISVCAWHTNQLCHSRISLRVLLTACRVSSNRICYCKVYRNGNQWPKIGGY